jgi:hypothetical protein
MMRCTNSVEKEHSKVDLISTCEEISSFHSLEHMFCVFCFFVFFFNNKHVLLPFLKVIRQYRDK